MLTHWGYVFLGLTHRYDSHVVIGSALQTSRHRLSLWQCIPQSSDPAVFTRTHWPCPFTCLLQVMGPGWGPDPGNFSSVWRDTWTLLSEDVSEDREMVYLPRRQGVVVFGALLAAWTLALNLLLLIVLSRGRSGRGPGLLLPGNLVLASLLTGAFVVPLSVRTESVGGWTLGIGTCRAWLLARVALAALTAWSVLAIVIDRLVYAVNPTAYFRRMSCGRVVALLVLCWVAALGAATPAAWFMATDPEFVLAEVCAVGVDAHYALGVSLVSFLVPSVVALLLTTALVTLALCARSRPVVAEDADGDAGQTQPCCPDREDDVSDTLPEYTTGKSKYCSFFGRVSLIYRYWNGIVVSLTIFSEQIASAVVILIFRFN